ncbi:hypothetical protein LDE03_04360 [Lactobacillus delbrueckii subsp. delbrueckii]|nr:hypothetical protein LDE01_10900 [Lactobacillus delbrueckii subsp. delbrueckii]GEA74628.1 hypothetical protein LDE03_04360 [Lactobacillus delbrueckii subsp. delbrueckii]
MLSFLDGWGPKSVLLPEILCQGLFYSLANFWPIDRTCHTLQGCGKQENIEARFSLIEGGNTSQVHLH